MTYSSELFEVDIDPRSMVNLLKRAAYSQVERWLLHGQVLIPDKKVQTIADLSSTQAPHRFLSPQEIFEIIERKNNPVDYDHIHDEKEYRDRMAREFLYNDLGIDPVMRKTPSFWQSGIDYDKGIQYWWRGGRENNYPNFFIVRATERANTKRHTLTIMEGVLVAPSSDALKKFLPAA